MRATLLLAFCWLSCSLSAQTPLSVSGTAQAAFCGTATGSIDLTVAGGELPYAFLWSDGSTTEDPDSLLPALYTVTVTDQTGATATFDIPVPDTTLQAGQVSAAVSPNTSCTWPNGAIQLQVDLPGEYGFIWSNGASFPDLSGLDAGTITVTITAGSSCSVTLSYEIANQQDTPQVNLVTTNSTCEFYNGAIDLQLTAGALPATYQWSSGHTTEDLQQIPLGLYRVTVTGANGCSKIAFATVGNETPVFTLQTVVLPNTHCSTPNGSIQVLVDPPGDYHYYWGHGPMDATLTMLTGGEYALTVSAGGVCTQTASYVVENQLSMLLLNVSATDESAPGANDGTMSCAPAGGVPPYTVQWSTGDSSLMVNGLSPGVYYLTVTDQHQCVGMDTVYFSAFGCALQPVFYPTAVRCYGDMNGKVFLEVNQGTPPYQFLWSHGDTTEYPTQLAAGWYAVTVADAAHCYGQFSVEITQPPVLEVILLGIQQPACHLTMTGQASYTILGGTPPYTGGSPNTVLENLGEGYYTIHIKDARSCMATLGFLISAPPDTLPPAIVCPPNMVVCGPDNIFYDMPVATDHCPLPNGPELVSGLESGAEFPLGEVINIWRVEDGAGHSATCSFTITTLLKPEIMVLSVINDLNGQGLGSITILATGDSLQYQWTKDSLPFSTSAQLSGLNGGVYRLMVTAANGCTAETGPIQVSDLSGTTAALQATAIQISPNPSTDWVQLEVPGALLRSARWYDPQGRCVQQRHWDQGVSQVQVDVSRWPSGTYQVVLTLLNGRQLAGIWMKG